MRIPLRRIAAGERPPWGYGLAWYDTYSGASVVFPVPFNYLAAALRWCSQAIRVVRFRGLLDQAYFRGYDEGRQSGLTSVRQEKDRAYQAGVADGRQAVCRELADLVDKPGVP